MYAVDSLRQLAMKFLERDELANYSFQNDFLKPFVIVMRLSRALEIRELIIRCARRLPVQTWQVVAAAGTPCCRSSEHCNDHWVHVRQVHVTNGAGARG